MQKIIRDEKIECPELNAVFMALFPSQHLPAQS